jgi:glutathione S-transferase
MYESAAINTYLCMRAAALNPSAPRLLPAEGTQQRGVYEQLVSCILTELDANGLWVHTKHERLAKIFGAAPVVVAAAKQHFAITLGVLATELRAAGAYLHGAEFSAADILLVHCLDWAAAIQWLDSALATLDAALTQHLREYRVRCSARPAYLRASGTKHHHKPAKL